MLVPTNPNLTDILGRTYSDCENLIFVDFVGFQIPRCPGSEISRFPDLQTPPLEPEPDELSDPNLNPLPTHPGIKYVAGSQKPLLQPHLPHT